MRDVQAQKKSDASKFLHKILRIATDIRNTLRVIVDKNDPADIVTFSERLDDYMDFLYAWQLLVSVDLYESLHTYKRLAERLSRFMKQRIDTQGELRDTDVLKCSESLTDLEALHAHIQVLSRQEFDSLLGNRLPNT